MQPRKRRKRRHKRTRQNRVNALPDASGGRGAYSCGRRRAPGVEGENMGINYESDDSAFPAAAYRVDGWKGIAFYVLGWETEPDDDTGWTGQENRTGNVVTIMVGDDRRRVVEPSDLHPIGENEYCPECGQMGCHCVR